MSSYSQNQKEQTRTNKVFAKFKFDLADAIASDRRLSPVDRCVAFSLMSFLNSDTGEAFPSVEVLASVAGFSKRAVRYSIAALRENGWLSVSRPDRRRSNVYAFRDEQIPLMLVGRKKSIRAAQQNTRLVILEGHHSATRDVTKAEEMKAPTGITVHPQRAPPRPLTII